MKFRKPMLAKDYEGNEDKVTYPCYVQPKLDGVRCITNGQAFWSRNGKMFPRQNFQHLQVKTLPFLLDGELSLYGDVPDFEDVVSVVKRAGHKDAKHLSFNAFDIMTDQPYVARKKQLKELFLRNQLRILSRNWMRVDTQMVRSAKELEDMYANYLDFGYEGMMVRSAFGLYVPKRTHDLMKYKPLQDAEFPIVAVKEAKGKDAGTPIFICAARPYTDEELTFRVRPMGTMQQRRQMWKDRRKLIGVSLTVEFQNLTKYGKPRFPRAKCLRDYE